MLKLFFLSMSLSILFGWNKKEYIKCNFSKEDSLIIPAKKIDIHCGSYIKQGLFKSQDELDESYDSHRMYDPSCDDSQTKHIDFTKYDFIWINESIGGCDKPTYTYELIRITKEKKYLLIVNIEQVGYCKALFPIKINLLCEKLAPDFKFEYKILSSVK